MSVIFQQIREAAASVADRATSVRINAEALRGFVGRIDLTVPDDDPGHEPMGDPESTAAFVMALDAVNFGSGYFPHLRKRPGMSGYGTTAACLRDHASARGPITSAWLRSVNAEEAAALFGQVPAEPPPAAPDAAPLPTPQAAHAPAPESAHFATLESAQAPAPPAAAAELMDLFARAWNDLGAFIDRVGGGTALGVTAAADGSAARLLALLAEMPFYKDVHRYRGLEVPFYKRAQITVCDMAAAFRHEPPGAFADFDLLTMFADNLVPHVLRIEGVLEFSDDLVARIAAAEDISCGSEPEIEIRACALHAVEVIVGELARRGRPCTAAHVDGVLWRMGGRRFYKAEPRHRTRSTYY